MKILICHNYYKTPGGEDVVVANEMELLREHGHEVMTYFRHNTEIDDYSMLRKAALYFQTTWSKKSFGEIDSLIKKEKPDIAHFHNTLPLISPSAYYACKNNGVPVVQTLHNFRLLCPGALFLRDGKVCEDCIGGDYGPALKYRCYRGSQFQTKAVVRMLRKHRVMNTFVDYIDCFIALTEFSKSRFVKGGISENKLRVKPNFIINAPEPPYKGDYAIAAGRLSGEKGVDVLVRAWENTNYPLSIAGDGPERENLEKLAGSNVKFTGQLPRDQILDLIKKAGFLVFPSICYENFPQAIIESFAGGTPVIASNLGAAAEIVTDNKTGVLFEPGNPDDLAAKAKILIDNPTFAEELGRNARKEFEEKYTPEKNYEMLMEIYNDTIGSYNN